MSNLGKYQDIVVEAHNSGGVDILLESIKTSAYEAGASDAKKSLAVPFILFGVTIGTVSVITCQKVKKWIVEKKEKKLLNEKKAFEDEERLRKELKTAMEEPNDDND